VKSAEQVQNCRCRGAEVQKCRSRGAAEVLSGCSGSAEVVVQVIVQVQRFCKGSAEVVQRCRCRCRDSAEFCRGAEAHTRCYGTELQRR
jgi:hypothetical protein